MTGRRSARNDILSNAKLTPIHGYLKTDKTSNIIIVPRSSEVFRFQVLRPISYANDHGLIFLPTTLGTSLIFCHMYFSKRFAAFAYGVVSLLYFRQLS